MVTLGLISTFILGFCWLQIFFHRLSIIEKIGGSFILGLGFQTLLMGLLEILSLPIDLPGIFTGTILLFAFPIVYALIRNKTLLYKFSATSHLPKITIAWLLVFGILVYVEYMNFSKCVYFPTFDRDSVAGFESIGYAIAKEKCIAHLSLFDADYQSFIHGPASYITYMPFTQLSYAYVYLLGAELSKIINALMFLSFILFFYGALQRKTSSTIAIIITLFMVMTPELMAWSSMSMTNVVQAIFASMAVIYGLLWISDERDEDLYLSAVLTGLNLWSRNEGLAIAAVLGFILLIKMIVSKKILKILPWTLLALLPFVVWNIYMKMAGMHSENIIITHPYWDALKFDTIYVHFKSLILNKQYYGWSFSTFFLFAAANAYFIWKKKHLLNFYTILFLVLSFALYFFVIYQVDYVWDTIENVLNYSVKRFFFCYIPVLWYFVGTSYLTERAGKWGDGFQGVSK